MGTEGVERDLRPIQCVHSRGSQMQCGRFRDPSMGAPPPVEPKVGRGGAQWSECTVSTGWSRGEGASEGARPKAVRRRSAFILYVRAKLGLREEPEQ